MKKLLLLITLVTLLTQNTHSQWIQQTVPVSKPITGIKFIDANTGWACTEYTGSPNTGYILYTSNGGTNWLIQDSTVNATFGAISVINANILYCGGYDFSSNSANLKKTTNGGLNWVLIPTPTNMAIADMVFLNQDSGWSCSSNVGADIRTTTNGGLNWIVRTNGIASQTQRIFFLNYSTGFCGANDNVLYKTTNAGLNWIANGGFTDRVNAIYFIDYNTGWIGLEQNKIVYTSNSGINWTYQTLPPNSSFTITDVYFYNNLTGWAGNRNIRIMKTVNGGLNWGYQLNPTASYRISFIDTSNGWIGDVGISRTTNGGGNITYVGINSISTETPSSYKLYQNYPNPFNPLTKINLDITERGFIKLIVYDVVGKTIKTLVNEILNTGRYEYTFESDNLPSGLYFYKLITNDYSETRKMILIK